MSDISRDRNGQLIRAHVAHPIDGGHGHSYPSICGWFCEVHGQVCDPFRTVSLNAVRDYAAKDASLSDDAFVQVSRALRGGSHQ